MKTVLIVVISVLATFITLSYAQTTVLSSPILGRYQIVAAQTNAWRVDTATGAVTYCFSYASGVNCVPAAMK